MGAEGDVEMMLAGSPSRAASANTLRTRPKSVLHLKIITNQICRHKRAASDRHRARAGMRKVEASVARRLRAPLKVLPPKT